MSTKKLTASLEDYLEIIYNQLEEYNSVKAIEISRQLGVSRASVTEALQKLAKQGLIKYGRYEAISITDLGIKKAQEVIEKHKILEVFFQDVLDLEQDEAKENACRIEHVISRNALLKIQKLTDFCRKNKEDIEL